MKEIHQEVVFNDIETKKPIYKQIYKFRVSDEIYEEYHRIVDTGIYYSVGSKEFNFMKSLDAYVYQISDKKYL